MTTARLGVSAGIGALTCENGGTTKDGPGRRCANTNAGSWASPISDVEEVIDCG